MPTTSFLTGFNWVDWTVIGILLLFILDGMFQTFMGEVLDFLAFLVALFASLRFYNYASNFIQHQFGTPHSLANVLGFFLIWVLSELAISFLARLLVAGNQLAGFLNRRLFFLSAVPAFFKGLIFVAVLLVLVATFPVQPRVKEAVSASKLGPPLLARAYQLETPFKDVFGGITQDTLTFLTVEPKENESVNLGFTLTNFKERPDLESQMIDLVNKERTSRGVKALIFNDKLRKIAIIHSDDMFRRGYFSHYSPEGKTVADRAQEYNIEYTVIGENIAYAPDLSTAHTGLMNSPGHRANILSPDYTKIGIGIDDSGDYGLMITQDFSN